MKTAARFTVRALIVASCALALLSCALTGDTAASSRDGTQTHTGFPAGAGPEALSGAEPCTDNRLDNPSFDEGLSGWRGPWARNNEPIRTAHDAASGIGKSGALLVEMSGSEDWSVQANTSQAVQAGEVWEVQAAVRLAALAKKTKKTADSAEAPSVQISCVSYNEEKEVLDWMSGLAETGSDAPTVANGDWIMLRERFFVPNGAQGIRFRITGRGAASWLVDNVALCRIREAPPPLEGPVLLQARAGGSSLELDREKGILRFGPTATARQTGEETVWTFDMSTVIPLIISTHSPVPERFEMTLADLWAGSITARFALDSAGQALISLEAPPDAPLTSDFAFPGPLKPAPGQDWILPVNEGLRVPADDPRFDSWNLELYGGHGLCMPFVGLSAPDSGILAIAETQNDAYVRFTRPGSKAGIDSTSTFGFVWQGERKTWGYPRRLRLVRTGSGHVAIAKAYREWAREEGRLVTLTEKMERVPQLEKMAGAVNLWVWERIDWWSQSEEFALELAEELEAAGVDRVLWSHEQTPETLTALNAKGWLTGRYDIYQDIWKPDSRFPWLNTEGWPDDIVLLPDGSPMKGWVHREEDGTEYPGGVISSAASLRLIKERVPKDLAKHPYGARFLDTTTANPLREDWNPLHPLSRSDDRRNKMALFDYLVDEHRLVVGSETGMDMAVPHLHYFEGMTSLGPYRLKDAGYDLGSRREPQEDFFRFQLGPEYRIPLFQLVYHDCVFSSWYWGDSSNRLIEYLPKRDLFNALYGTLPLWIVDRARWAHEKDWLLASYRNISPLTRQVTWSELVDHRYLSADKSLQYSRFEAPDGSTVEVWGNFAQDKSVAVDTGTMTETIPPWGFLVRNADGSLTHSTPFSPRPPLSTP